MNAICHGILNFVIFRDDIAQQLKGLQEQADDGEFPADLLKEVNSDTAKAAEVKPDSVADVVVEKVAKAGEAVQEIVGKANEVVQDVVGKASSFLKNLGSNKQQKQAEL